MPKHPIRSLSTSFGSRTHSPPVATSFNEAPNDHGGFVTLLLNRIGWDKLNSLGPGKRHGRYPHKLSKAQLLMALLFHYTATSAGTFAEHLLLLLGIKMAESTLSERRQALPFEVFEQLLELILRPLDKAPPQAFYQDMRLVAIDGVSFSLANTSQVNQRATKGANAKGSAGFAKLQCAVLIELVMHNPLAARIGLKRESEWKLARGLIGHLPHKCLLITDRLYGCGAFINWAQPKLKEVGGHLLTRVKESLKILRCVQSLEDGSRIVEIRALNPQDYHQVVATMEVREIRATLTRPGFRPVKIRLWTTLRDARQHPAQELIELYISRWEQELYFRQLKSELGINDLLRSQTVETAAQEVAAMIVGSCLIAQERAGLENGQEPAYRISFKKVWESLEPLWLTLLLGADLLSPEQKQQLADRFYWLASTRKIPKKRTRSCPRVMRQPAQPWPRKRTQKSSNQPVSISICHFP